EERITLSAAIGDGLQAWTARVEADAPQLFSRDLYDDPAQVTTEVSESTPTEPAPDAVPASAPAAPTPDPEPAVSGAPVTDGPEPAAPNHPTESEDPDMSGTQTGPAPGTAGTATAAEAPTVSAEARVEIVTAQ